MRPSKQKVLCEKYHSDQQESVDSTIRPVRLRKINKAETTKRNTSKKRRGPKADVRIEVEQHAVSEYSRALDATKGTHMHKDQNWFGGLSAYNNYSDEAHS